MNSSLDLKSLLSDYERRLILTALEDHKGNQRRAAAALGVLPTTLHEKMKRLGLKPANGAQEPAGESALSEPPRHG